MAAPLPNGGDPGSTTARPDQVHGQRFASNRSRLPKPSVDRLRGRRGTEHRALRASGRSYLDTPTDELWRRIEARSSEPPWDSYPIRRADFDGWLRVFQAPDAAELALFDSPPDST
jgi:hypothetical protein